MMPLYFLALGFAMFAAGISGIAVSRHFLIMMLSIEVALVAATLLAAAFFYFSSAGNVLILLLAIWSVAAMEVVALVAVYRYMARFEVSMDVSKLNKMKY